MFRQILMMILAFCFFGINHSSAFEISHMIADFERPYIYAIQDGDSVSADSLLFIEVGSEQIIGKISIGHNVTDMSINYFEDKLYVTNQGYAETRVVDLISQQELPHLEIGTDVYRINAGRAGRIYTEGGGSGGTFAPLRIIDSNTQDVLRTYTIPVGDAEVDPGREIYYRCESGITPAKLFKLEIRGDSLLYLNHQTIQLYGSKNLILSEDGRSLFCQGYKYDADLVIQINLRAEIFETTYDGGLGFCDHGIINTYNRVLLYTFPHQSNVMAVSGNQEKLFLYCPDIQSIEVLDLNEIIDLPGPCFGRLPEDSSVVTQNLQRLSWQVSPETFYYNVFLGTNEDSVALADTTSIEYLGTTSQDFMELENLLESNQRYYWRVDRVGFDTVYQCDILTFTTLPVELQPWEVSKTAWINAAVSNEQIILNIVDTLAGGEVQTDLFNWSVEENISWLILNKTGGTFPDTLKLKFDTENLWGGVWQEFLRFSFDSHEFYVPVILNLKNPVVVQMLTDYERPYIYALHKETGQDEAYLLIINTVTEMIDKIMPIGSNPTDMTINYREKRLYVTDWGNPTTNVVDLETFNLLKPLELGNDVYKINAGRPGRVYFENEDQWININIVDTRTGTIIGNLGHGIREGDGEVDRTGDYYYHSDNNSSRSQIHKYDISTDDPFIVAETPEFWSAPRNLVLSRDGSRLFWRNSVYDSDLNELFNIGSEIFAVTADARYAVSGNMVLDAGTGDTIYTFPLATPTMAFSGDESKLFMYYQQMLGFVIIPMAMLEDLPCVVNGIVTDSLQVPIESVLVTLYSMNPYNRDHDYTDEDGYFELDSLVYDPFIYYPAFLQFTKDYYNDTTIYDIEFYPGDTTFYHMELRRVGPIPYDPPMKKSEFAQVPSSFFINQNYPNPFNAGTAICFDLPQSCNVTLTVFNVLGQLVDEPVNSYLEAGTHTIIWNPGNISSGTYFYRLQAGTYHSLKKMTILK